MPLTHLLGDHVLKQILSVLHPELKLLATLVLVSGFSVDLTLARPEESLKSIFWFIDRSLWLRLLLWALRDFWRRRHGEAFLRLPRLRPFRQSSITITCGLLSTLLPLFSFVMIFLSPSFCISESGKCLLVSVKFVRRYSATPWHFRFSRREFIESLRRIVSACDIFLAILFDLFELMSSFTFAQFCIFSITHHFDVLPFELFLRVT